MHKLHSNWILTIAPNHTYWDIIQKWIDDNFLPSNNRTEGDNLIIHTGGKISYYKESALINNMHKASHQRLSIHQFIGLSGIWIPKRGEKVYYKSYTGSDISNTGVYAGYVKGARHPYLIVKDVGSNYEDFLEGRPFDFLSCAEVSKYKLRLTIEEIAQKYNISPSELEIINS